LDGTAIQLGRVYSLPGAYVLRAEGPNGSSAEERLRTNAGVTYRVVLHPEAAPGAPSANTAVAPGTSSTAAADQRSTAASDAEKEHKKTRPLSPPVFYAAAAVSVVLIGLTTWSGIDTLKAKSDLGEQPKQKDLDAVESRVLRTDLLLAGSAILSGFTVYSAFFLVDFDNKNAAPAGATLGLRGRF
jgi:hypothetical protein